MTKINSQIEIIMSTFNGASYIEEQLDSIVAQTHDDWRLLIRDDGSVDATLEIISVYVDRYKDRITLLQDERGNIGPCASFGVLLESTTADYVALCDQDDVWLPGKLESQLHCIREVEAGSDENLPVLVHSDLCVVDQGGAMVAASFWRYQKLRPSRMQSLHGLLVQNCVTGCATMVNRSLIKLATPISKQAIMHDWWLALFAASEGRICFMNDATLKYRQHSRNDTGAKKWGMGYISRMMFAGSIGLRNGFFEKRDQAIALLQSGRLCDKNKEDVGKFARLFEKGWFHRRLIIIREGFWMDGAIRNIGMMIWI